MFNSVSSNLAHISNYSRIHTHILQYFCELFSFSYQEKLPNRHSVVTQRGKKLLNAENSPRKKNEINKKSNKKCRTLMECYWKLIPQARPYSVYRDDIKLSYSIFFNKMHSENVLHDWVYYRYHDSLTALHIINLKLDV